MTNKLCKYAKTATEKMALKLFDQISIDLIFAFTLNLTITESNSIDSGQIIGL